MKKGFAIGLFIFLLIFKLDLRASSIFEQILQVKGGTLFCKTLGKGSPLLILHGGPGLSQDYLFEEFSSLSEENFLIFYDQRGSGKSTATDLDLIGIETFVEDIETIRAHFGFKKISLVGHSWGGFLAMKYAISHPKHVDKLILSNSMPASFDEFQGFLADWGTRTEPYREELDQISKTEEFLTEDPTSIKRYYRTLFRAYFYDAKRADLLNLNNSSSPTSSKVYQAFSETLFANPFNLHEELQKLHLPTLVIHGDSDLISSRFAESLHKSIPGSKYALMEKCGHFPYLEDAESYFGYLREFLKNSG